LILKSSIPSTLQREQWLGTECPKNNLFLQ